jgi:hypothetical protein
MFLAWVAANPAPLGDLREVDRGELAGEPRVAQQGVLLEHLHGQ